MAEGNEQPTLLGDESEKKPKRSRSAPGSSAKRAPARKTGGKRPTKSNHLEIAEPSQGLLLETAGRSSNEGNSEIKAADGSVRQAADHSVTKNEGARPEEKPIASHRTNAALEVAERPETVPAENGRHRVHS